MLWVSLLAHLALFLTLTLFCHTQTVAFTEGELRPESYEANDTYRIVTAEEGFMQLRPHWHDFVCKACEAVN